TVCSGSSRPPISPSSTSKSWGLTAITTSAAPAIASAFESVAVTPCRSATSRSQSSRRPVTTISPGSRHPELRRPLSSDSPIRPAPRIASRRGSIAMRGSLGGGVAKPGGRRTEPRSVRQRDQPAPEAHEQVDAREAGPLAVALQQRRRLLGLDPAPLERAEQLDQPEVADQAALAPAEAFEADDAHRPRAEPALAQKARCDRVGR